MEYRGCVRRLLPVWFAGSFGGSVVGMPIWNHPRMEENFVGAMRHFLTDPLPFEQSAEFGYTPGTDPKGAPAKATAIVLWYRFGQTPYAAPALAGRAEPLPHSTYPMRPTRLGPGRKPYARLIWSLEAEDLAPMARARDCELDVVEDRVRDAQYVRAATCADSVSAMEEKVTRWQQLNRLLNSPPNALSTSERTKYKSMRRELAKSDAVRAFLRQAKANAREDRKRD